MVPYERWSHKEVGLYLLRKGYLADQVESVDGDKLAQFMSGILQGVES